MNESMDRVLSDWLHEGPESGPREGLERALAATRRVAQRPGWTLPERWLPTQLTTTPTWLQHPIRAGVVALVVAVAGGGALFAALSSGPVPADDPRSPFLGTWLTTDSDGSTPTMTIRTSGDGNVEIVVHDDFASVCSGAPSTMTGTGRLEGTGELVIPTPVLTCDDGSEPQALSGPLLSEQLRNLTFVLDPDADTLSDNFASVWWREGAQNSRPEPTISGSMWPQSSFQEVQQAQELADAGDPRYPWQVDPELAAPDAAPRGAEILDRFLREELGWEEFSASFMGSVGGEGGGGIYDWTVKFIRCAPGRTNPLYPNDPEGRGCAPTIDDFRYETVNVSVAQPARRAPSGIWVVTRWEMMLLSAEPRSTFEHLYPDSWDRQVEQLAPPSDAEVAALMQAFLGARLDGDGAEKYLHAHEADGPRSPAEEVPILYATTGGSPYERSEIERVQGPVWPTGWIELKVRLFAEDGTVVEQSFVVVRQENGRLGLMYYRFFDGLPTTENGQAVPVPYSLLDGEVTFAAAPPWGDTILDRTFAVLGGVGRGSASQFTMFAIVPDPLTFEMGCEAGPAPADAEALARSIRSNPDLVATAPVAVSVGGIDVLQLDVEAAPGASDCGPKVLIDRLSAGQDGPMRLYLLDLPEGMSARILAIAISAVESEFEYVVEAAAPILDSFEFHTR